VRVGRFECDAWASYYRHEWPAFLRAAFGMVRAGVVRAGLDFHKSYTLKFVGKKVGLNLRPKQ